MKNSFHGLWYSVWFGACLIILAKVLITVQEVHLYAAHY